MKLNNIYNMDCFEGLAILEDKSIDYAFTSPPYNRKRNDKYSFYDDTITDYYGFLVMVIEQLRRVVKKHIFLNLQTNYYNKADVYRFIGAYADIIQNIIVWEKSNPMPANGRNVTNSYEFFIVIGDSSLKANTTYTKNHITTSVNSKCTSKIHKAVMNPDVARWMFDSFIPNGSTVIDPFMGFGTTAIVCKEHDCPYIGFEIVKEYCDIANQKVNEVYERRTS